MLFAAACKGYDMIKSFLKNEEGATMVEYGLLAALIAAVVAAGVSTLGTELDTQFTNIGNCVNDPQNQC